MSFFQFQFVFTQKLFYLQKEGSLQISPEKNNPNDQLVVRFLCPR